MTEFKPTTDETDQTPSTPDAKAFPPEQKSASQDQASDHIVTGDNTEDKVLDDEAPDEGYLLMWGEETAEEKPTSQTDEKRAEAESIVATEEPVTETQKAPGDVANFRRPWILMVVGALLGAFIALALIYSANGGTVIFARHPKVIELDSELSTLKRREVALTEAIGILRAELGQYDELNNQLQSSRAEIEILKRARANLAGQIAILEAENALLTTRATVLEEQLLAAAEQISNLERDTGRFDGFLNGLRDLLSADQGIAPTAEATATATPTSTRTPAPTRTPSPTPTSAN